MNKQIKSNFAIIYEESGTIELRENRPAANGHALIIEDCVLDIDEDNRCNVKGNRNLWGLKFGKTFLSELDYEVVEHHTKLGYKSLMDRWKGIKSPYVEGWHRKVRTLPYSAIISKFYIIL